MLCAVQSQSIDGLRHLESGSLLMLVSPVCAAYFVQGVKMSLGTLTEQFYLKDDLQFDPAQVTCPLPVSDAINDFK